MILFESNNLFPSVYPLALTLKFELFG